MNISAVILAGGKGTRLSSVSSVPKPLVKVNGVPILESIIYECKRNSIHNFVILLQHGSKEIIDYLGSGVKYGVEIKYIIESNPRGTAGALLDSLEILDESFFIIYADTFLKVDMKKMFKWHCKNEADLTCFVHPNSHPYDSDILEINKKSQIVRVFRPRSDQTYKNIVNAAFYILKKKSIDFTLEEPRPDIAKDLIPAMINRSKKVLGYKSCEYIKDMGTPQRLLQVTKDIKNGIPDLRFKKRKAVFIDRDGTVNQHNGYIDNISKLKVFPFSSSAIGKINASGMLAILITNQPVIARGELTENGLEEIHNFIESEIGRKGAYFDEIYFCPHHPDSGFEGEVKALKIACDCRKPAPGMILDAVKEMDIDLENSWVIGDSLRDIECARNLKMKSLLVLSGEIKDKKNLDRCCVTMRNLEDAVDYILNFR